MAHVSLRTLIAPPGGKRERAVVTMIGMVEQRAQINHQAWWAEPYIIVCDHEEDRAARTRCSAQAGAAPRAREQRT